MIVRTQTYCGRMSAIDSRVSSSPTTQHITKAVLRVYVSIYIYYEMAEKISGNLKFDAQGTARHVQDGTPSGQKLESYKKFAVNLQPGTKGVIKKNIKRARKSSTTQWPHPLLVAALVKQKVTQMQCLHMSTLFLILY
jgi:hypothetical protein